MRKMKDSGIQWIGEIPEEWETRRVKYIALNGLQYGANESGVDYDAKLPRYIRITDISYDNKLKFEDMLSLQIDKSERFILNDGDILFARSGATAGKSFYFKKGYGYACFAGYLIRLTVNSSLIDSKLAYYYTLTSSYEEWIKQTFIQATIQNVSAEKYNNLVIPFTKSKKEQQHIADYLDNKCSQIDSIIEAKEKTNEKLKEYRQSIIYEAVTKGLDKNMPMKDSGIQWIGKIPAGWGTKRFRYIYNIIGGNGFKEHLQGREKGDYPFYKVSDINESGIYAKYANNYVDGKDIAEQNFNIIPRNSLIIAKIGEALKKNHRKISTAKCVIDNNMQALVPIENINSLYFYYQWLCIDMIWFDNGGTIPSVNNTNLKSFYLVYPDIEEQQQIADYLDNKCSQIDSVIEANEKTIEKLKEYRQSIIYEAVTGKIEI